MSLQLSGESANYSFYHGNFGVSAIAMMGLVIVGVGLVVKKNRYYRQYADYAQIV